MQGYDGQYEADDSDGLEESGGGQPERPRTPQLPPGHLPGFDDLSDAPLREVAKKFATDPAFRKDFLQYYTGIDGYDMSRRAPGKKGADVPLSLAEDLEEGYAPELRWLAPEQAKATLRAFEHLVRRYGLLRPRETVQGRPERESDAGGWPHASAPRARKGVPRQSPKDVDLDDDDDVLDAISDPRRTNRSQAMALAMTRALREAQRGRR
jgi:hypothetical protein